MIPTELPLKGNRAFDSETTPSEVTTVLTAPARQKRVKSLKTTKMLIDHLVLKIRIKGQNKLNSVVIYKTKEKMNNLIEMIRTLRKPIESHL